MLCLLSSLALARAWGGCLNYDDYLHTVSTLDISRAQDIEIVGERAYATATDGLIVLDISDALHPMHCIRTLSST
jgi:hypothetical protein